MQSHPVFNQKLTEALANMDSSVTKISEFSGVYDFTAFFHRKCSYQQQEAILKTLDSDIELIVVDCNDVTYFLKELPEALKPLFLKNCKNVISKSELNIAQLAELFHPLNSTESVTIVLEALGENVFQAINSGYMFNFFINSFVTEKKSYIADFLINSSSKFIKNEVDYIVVSKNLTLTQWRQALNHQPLSIKTLPEVCRLLNHLMPEYANVFLITFYDELNCLIVGADDIDFLHKCLNEVNFKAIFSHLKGTLPSLIGEWQTNSRKCSALENPSISAVSVKSGEKLKESELMLAEMLIGIAKNSSGQKRALLIQKIKEKCPRVIKDKVTKTEEYENFKIGVFQFALSVSLENCAIVFGVIVAAIALLVLLTFGFPIVPCALTAISSGLLSGITFFSHSHDYDVDLPEVKTGEELNAEILITV